MASVLNALFGQFKDDKKHQEKVQTTTGITAGSSSGSTVSHTSISDDVRVHSVVSTETNTGVHMQNSKKIADLMNKLGTTHNQVDEYAKKRTAEIGDAVAKAIEKVVADTAIEQQQLLADANQRSAMIDNEHKQRLQEYIAQLDNEKVLLLAELERTLSERQEAILFKATQDIDFVQNAANDKKMAVFKMAQAQDNQQINQITEQVAELAAEDAQRRVQSTTQTVITTQSVVTGESHMSGAHGVATTTTATRRT